MLKEEELPSRVEERAPGLEEVGLARLATAVSALATLGMMTVEMTLKDAASSRFAWPSPPRCGVACRASCGVPCGVPRLRARRLLVSTKESWMSLREIMRWLARLVAKVLRSLVPKALMLPLRPKLTVTTGLYAPPGESGGGDGGGGEGGGEGGGGEGGGGEGGGGEGGGGGGGEGGGGEGGGGGGGLGDGGGGEGGGGEGGGGGVMLS